MPRGGKCLRPRGGNTSERYLRSKVDGVRCARIRRVKEDERGLDVFFG